MSWVAQAARASEEATAMVGAGIASGGCRVAGADSRSADREVPGAGLGVALRGNPEVAGLAALSRGHPCIRSCARSRASPANGT